MSLQKKLVILVNACVIIASLLLGVASFMVADHGFEVALIQKAESDVNQMRYAFNESHPGAWEKKADGLYKGNFKVNGDEVQVDHFAELSGNNVTFFEGATRVATSFKDASGKRIVGTSASEKVQEEVLKQGNTLTGMVAVEGKEYLAVYDPIKDANGQTIGMLYMGIPVETLDNLKTNFIYTMAGITVVMMIIFTLVSTFIAKKVVAPIVAAVDVLNSVSNGDLTVPDINASGQDEIATMGKAINTTKEKLRKLLSTIRDSAQQTAAASEELTASAEQISGSLTNVANNVVNMAGAVTEQTRLLGDMKDKADGMGHEMNNVLKKAEGMQTASEQSRAGAEEGQKIVRDAIAQIGSMNQKMQEASKVVAKLGENSKEISQIVDTITAITEQTNLLALNAAIEAARAGEAGRGFAVVAEEVRKLAAESAEAAQSISELIHTIQADTDNAVIAMESGQQEAAQGGAMVENTGTTFQNINGLISSVNEHIEAARNSIHAANDSTGTVIDGLNSVEKLSQDTASEAESVSAATEEQTAMVNEMADASRALAIMAQGLQDEIMKFKI